MKKYLVLSLLIILLIGFIVFLYYYSVWSDEHEYRQHMIDKAYNSVPSLKTIEEVDYFTGKKEYYFLFGKDNNDLPLLIWVNEEEIYTIYLFKWVTKDEIEKSAKTYAPGASIERINAGIDEDNKLIYEVLYRNQDGRLGYQYFSLRDGKLLSMYLLGKVN